MLKIDMWYGNSRKDIAYADCFFSDVDCIYRGNVYAADGKAIGDYATRDSVAIENRFPGIFGN